ncbi:MAG: pyrD [Rickettsiaceae bacterium]|jgi:dihydroorotate dehydrogenase|nr:pyrD [Rickettsiaceae bacterium]
MDYYPIIKPFIYKFSPETAHNLAIFALKNKLLPKAKSKSYPSLAAKVFGLEFDNPVGLAAGFDKNGFAIDGLLTQGFGFVEVGTVTPKPQSGNPKPRLFRLTEDEAVINRFGFNNKGAKCFAQNLQNRKTQGIVGANIGKNKDSADAVSDYIYMMERVYACSDYITINISSPNTPGLRDLQNKDELDNFLAVLLAKKEELVKFHQKNIPMLLKLAPDTNSTQRAEIAEIVTKRGVDGLIISNTTVARTGIKSQYANEAGGLSGRPLFNFSTQMVKEMYQLTGGKLPIIGVGGIFSAQDAYAKIRAGASLVQVYSALVYKGFGLVEEIKVGLAELLAKDGFSHVYEAVGADVVTKA